MDENVPGSFPVKNGLSIGFLCETLSGPCLFPSTINKTCAATSLCPKIKVEKRAAAPEVTVLSNGSLWIPFPDPNRLHRMIPLLGLAQCLTLTKNCKISEKNPNLPHIKIWMLVPAVKSTTTLPMQHCWKPIFGHLSK